MFLLKKPVSLFLRIIISNHFNNLKKNDGKENEIFLHGQAIVEEGNERSYRWGSSIGFSLLLHYRH
jgi:hypothetical protein